MKKNRSVLAGFLTLILSVCVSLTVCAKEAPRAVETDGDAGEWIDALLGEQPEKLEGRWKMTPQMEAAVSGMGGMAGLAKQLAVLGDFMERSPSYEEKKGKYTVFHIPCVFSAMSVDLLLSVEDGAIAGLTTGAYSGNSGEEADSDSYDSLKLALPVPALEGELPGILTIPKGEGPFPAVVLLQGSGPCDMDETIGAQKPFKDLAQGLAEHGIAVYRFDKRTYVYGSEMAGDTDLTLMDETIEDALEAVQLLASQNQIDPDRIFVLGHSLGGIAVPAVAGELQKKPVKASGYILMAASLRPLDELMREQVDFLSSLEPEVTKEQQAEKDALFADLDRLADLDSLAKEDQILGAYPAYWRWLSDYDIHKAAGEIKEPVLLLQGEEDYQVTMEDYGLWKDAFSDRENWKMISYPGLTHTFTPGKKTEGSAVYLRKEKVDDKVIGDIADFITEAGAVD